MTRFTYLRALTHSAYCAVCTLLHHHSSVMRSQMSENSTVFQQLVQLQKKQSSAFTSMLQSASQMNWSRTSIPHHDNISCNKTPVVINDLMLHSTAKILSLATGGVHYLISHREPFTKDAYHLKKNENSSEASRRDRGVYFKDTVENCH